MRLKSVTTRGDMGQMVLTVLGMVAPVARRFIKERQREGVEKAKQEGVYRGGVARIDLPAVFEAHAAGAALQKSPAV